jgi:hypothetical protein
LETSVAFITETVMVVALATSCAGTVTASAVQELPPGQFTGVTELGVRTAPPNLTCDVIPRPVPVIVSMKFPLLAGTLVGEMATMLGCTVGGGGGGGGGVKELLPQPKSNKAEVNTAHRSTEPLRMETLLRPQAARFVWLRTIEATPQQLQAIDSSIVCEYYTRVSSKC